MPKKRLNQDHRTMLRHLAQEKVNLEFKELADKSHTKEQEIFTEFTKALRAKAPARDMYHLRKHGCTKVWRKLNNIQIYYTPNKENACKTYTEYSYRITKEMEVPSSWSDWALDKVFTADEIEPFEKRMKEVYATLNKIEKDKAEALSPYKSLIFNARYFEDVVEVWEEAAELTDKICTTGTALVTLSDEDVMKIKKDVKKRKVA